MKRPMLRLIATLVLATMGVLTGDTSGNACLFPWFGCGGSPCGTGYCGGYYRPTYAAYYPMAPYYSPCCGGGCSSGCAPSCGSCCGASYSSCNLGCCPVVTSSCSPWGCPVQGCCGTVSGCCGAGVPGSGCSAGPSGARPSPPPAAHPPGTDGNFKPRSYEPQPGIDSDRPANPKTTGAAQPTTGTDPAYEKPLPGGTDGGPTPKKYTRENGDGAPAAPPDTKAGSVPPTFRDPAPSKATSDQPKKSDAGDPPPFESKKPVTSPETPPPSGKKAPMPKTLDEPKATDLEPSGPALQLQDRATWHVSAMRRPVNVGIKTAAAPVPERITSTSAEWVLLPVDTRLARE